MTSTQLQSMDDIALIEAARREVGGRAYQGGGGQHRLEDLIGELANRFEPHAQAPDHQDYPFIANEENLK